MSTDALPKSRYRSRTVFRHPSQLLVGTSIAAQLRDSSYGAFHKYLSECGLEAQYHFRLPCVIVVGSRSAGKSTLLEAITKCAIFPRHRHFCTKMPIELHMKNDPTAIKCQISTSYPGRNTRQLQTAEEIVEEIDDIMHSVPGVEPEPIIVEICQADVPTFTVIDLPGIQSYPEEQEKATTDLVNTYLNRPETLVLCVVDATTAALNTSVAIELIRKAGKLSNTIIALTKSDLLSEEEEYVPMIFDRILGDSTDSAHLMGLVGCVAVANRQQNSSMPLADSDAAECKVFSRMLHDPAEAFAPPVIQQQLREHMTVRQLIVQLDRMFHSYILEHWKPAAMEKIRKLMIKFQSQLDRLGPPVEELTANGVMTVVLSEIDVGHLCQTVKSALRDLSWHSPGWNGQMAEVLQDQAWGSLPWVESLDSVDIMVELLLGYWSDVGPGALLKSAQKCCAHIFNADPEPKLKRFSQLHYLIADTLLPAHIANVMENIKPKLQQLADINVAELYAPWTEAMKLRIINLNKAFQGCILSHFVRGTRRAMQQPSKFQLPQGFTLVEDTAVQQKRAALDDNIARLQIGYAQMSCIEEAFRAPVPPSTAIAASVHDSSDLD